MGMGDEWVTVGRGRKNTSGRGKRMSKSKVYHVSAPNTAASFSSSAVNADHVLSLAKSLQGTPWWQQTATHVLQMAVTQPSSKYTIHCLGLGSFSQWKDARHQLACACLLRELLEAERCFVGDPCMNEADEVVLQQLNMIRKEWEPSKSFGIQTDSLSLVFLPHCSREMNENVFRALDQCGALGKVVFLANQVSLYFEVMSTRMAGHTKFIEHLYKCGRLEEKACPRSTLSSSETAFNDLCVMRVLPEGKT